METAQETAPRNGKAKADNASANPDKPKRQRKMKMLPTIGNLANMKEVVEVKKVDSVQTDWKTIPVFHEFSLSEDGKYKCVKSSKSSYIDTVLKKQVVDVCEGRGYLIFSA
jgi:hypothetical protein